MPYDVKKQGGQWVTYTKTSGKVHGHFGSKKQAMRQLRALYANASPESEKKKK